MKNAELLKLADYLEVVVKDDDFDIDYWHCGTTACAGGHACSIFPELSLVPVVSEGKVNWNICHYDREIVGVFGINYGFTALAKFFNISQGQSIDLFSPQTYTIKPVTKQHVIDRIRNLVSSGGIINESMGTVT